MTRHPFILSLFLLLSITIAFTLFGLTYASDLFGAETVKGLSYLPLWFFLINSSAIAIVFFTLKKEPKEQTLALLAAISVKMLAEMVLALIWFYDGKNSSAHSVILFFVLYLTFSLFSILTILKALKKKTL